jgi:PAS domain S-box-containing protein
MWIRQNSGPGMSSDEALPERRRTIARTPYADRLRVLMSPDDVQSEPEALRLALAQAVAAIGGLGGMVHLRTPGKGGRLRLAVSNGLPRGFTRAWEEIEWDEGTLGSALSQGAVVRDAGTGRLPAALSARFGIVAVPLPALGEPLGVLSVVNATRAPLPAVQRDFLSEVARWVSERLEHPADGAHPAWRLQEPSAGSRFRTALATVGVGAWEWNVRSGDMYMNEAALAVFGIQPNTFDGRFQTWAQTVHPEDRPWVLAAADEAVRKGGLYTVEYRVRRPDGTVRWVRSRAWVALGEDGEPARVSGALWDSTEARAALDSVGHALRHMSDGFLTLGSDWRITFANAQAQRLLGSSGELVGQVLWEIPAARVPDLEKACRQAVRSGTPADFEMRWPVEQRWYHVRLLPGPDGLTVYFTDVTDRRLMDAEHAAAAERAAHIGRLTVALTEAVTVQDVVSAVAERVLPPFGATGLLVQRVENEYLRTVGSAGYSQEFIGQFSTRLSEPTPSTAAFRDRTPQYIGAPKDYARRFPDFTWLARDSGKHAWAFLPLIVSGQPVGCCIISFSRPHRFREEERALLDALSGLIAQALERARLYDAEHQRTQQLQQGLLPRFLPSLPAVTTAARYLPAGEGADVGGDWYDVIPLSGERVALVIGDVIGHGLPEAVTMGRLRTAVWTLAELELPPGELLAHLNDLVSDLGDDHYATCLYAVYDSTMRTCTFARAGHPPPALVRPGGTVLFHTPSPDPPLGVATPPFETVELDVPDGSLLVLYTNGLIESARHEISSGMDSLADALTAGLLGRFTEDPAVADVDAVTAGEPVADAVPLGRLCDRVIRALVPTEERTSDDAALLIARTHALTPENMANWTLPQDPIAASEARDHVRQQLARWDLDELTMTTELLVSELVGNVVRHARGPIGLRLLRGRSLTCEVSDGSHTTPRIRRAQDTDEGGRGLQLVAALSQRWGTRYTADGKCIWTEQPFPGAP